MSWLDILQKNDQEFETSFVPETVEQEEHIIDLNILDADEEFDYLYFNKIVDVKCYFQDFIRDECLPFMNRPNIDHYFYDFIKYNCSNYYKLEQKIDEENEEYLNEQELETEDEDNYEDNYDKF